MLFAANLGASDHAQKFQPEIQGIRAFSVLAVVAAHAGLPGLPGGFTGVDVFFVISGFLITRLLASEMARTGRIDLLAFWARRARRLLPNAYATLIATALLALVLQPGYDLAALAGEIGYAALEIVNFHFAEKAVDYFQSDAPASPVLHFWSLAVEEQFYIIWPLLLIGVGITFRRRFLWVGCILLGAIWLASFAASLCLTVDNPAYAYFASQARCWQLATGALLAVGWRGVERVPPMLRIVMAWFGMAAILAGIVVLNEHLRYPGQWALLPTFGAAALTAGFEAASPASLLRRGLSLPAMQWIGARSYSWYLWHWPLLVLPRAAFPDGHYIEVIAVPASLAVACLAFSWLETPVRQSRRLRTAPLPTLAAAAAALAVVIGVGNLYRPALPRIHPQLATRIAQIEAASVDITQVYKENCHLSGKRLQQPDCLYGAPGAPRRIVLFGDSHAAHWFEAVNAAAKQSGWQLRSWTKSACPSAQLSLARSEGRRFSACDEWRANIMARLTGTDRPDLVIISNHTTLYLDRVYDPATGRHLPRDDAKEAIMSGLRRTISTLLAAGIDVAMIRDVPHANEDYRRCFLDGRRCARLREQALVDRDIEAEVANEFRGRAKLIDFTDTICGAKECPIMSNGVFIYRNVDHLTAAYAATFAPQIAGLLQELAETPQTKPALPRVEAELGARVAARIGGRGSEKNAVGTPSQAR